MADYLYTDALDPDEQIHAEEWIAGYVLSNIDVPEEVAGHMGREILLEVLTRFRPDLLERD